MPGHLHALLVGIDDYPAPARRLSGCVRDVAAMKEFLETRMPNRDHVAIRTLKNEQAARLKVISSFREHLGQAGPGDTALFYFAGHGSQEPSPVPYAWTDPGGRSQGLLAYDSAGPRDHLLADKELAVLVAEVVRRDAHVVVILDSCHSGTGTRDGSRGPLPVRLELPKRVERPPESYWFWGEAELPAKLGVAGGWRCLPRGRHVLLAACEDHQVAWEIPLADGTSHGCFTHHLLTVLSRRSQGITYGDLLREVQLQVTRRHPDQRPDGEGDLSRVVLDGTLAPRPARFHVVRPDRKSDWRLDAGRVHGVLMDSELAVLRPGVTSLTDICDPIARVQVTDLAPESSSVRVLQGALPDDHVTCPAVFTRLPHAALRIAMECPPAADVGAAMSLTPSPFLEIVDGTATPDLFVRVLPRGFTLHRPHLDSPLAEVELGAEPRPEDLVAALERVARAETLTGLKNPEDRLVGQVELTLYEWQAPLPDEKERRLSMLPSSGEIRLQYGLNPRTNELAAPRLAIQLTNRSVAPLYMGLLAVSETFGVHVVGGVGHRLQPGDFVFLYEADGYPCWVPDEYYRQGITQRRDLLILVATDRPVDFAPLVQERLAKRSRRPGSPVVSARRPSLFETLFRHAVWREVGDEPRPQVGCDWTVLHQAVVTERPRPWVWLAGGVFVDPVARLTLRGPEQLQGRVRLHNLAAAHARCPALGALRPNGGLRRPLALGRALASDSGLAVVELELENRPAVTREQPLFLEVADGVLSAGEALAAIVSDGSRSVLSKPSRGDSTGACTAIPGVRPAPAQPGFADATSAGRSVWIQPVALEQ